jgi:protein-tyrosine-phosphatase
MPSVLFVCTANRIRSPLAQELFKQKLDEAALPGEWRVESAGTWAPESQPPLPRALQTAQQMGLDISAHRSRNLNARLVATFDLILVMERSHKEALQVEFPHYAHKVYLLSEMIGQTYDIADPVGKPQVDYNDAANQIEAILARSMDRIRSLAGEQPETPAG